VNLAVAGETSLPQTGSVVVLATALGEVGWTPWSWWQPRPWSSRRGGVAIALVARMSRIVVEVASVHLEAPWIWPYFLFCTFLQWQGQQL